MRFFSPDDKYLQQIKDMCVKCFDMEMDEVDYIFEQKYLSADICYAIEEDERLCCMLFTVPCAMMLDGKLRKGHYIYGACTLPEYRHRGFMHRLIDYANTMASDKGDEFSVLLPASKPLYDFYTDMGYRTLYTAKNEVMSKDKLPDMSVALEYYTEVLPEKIEKLRNSLCCKYSGSVIYSKNILKYAVSYAKECDGGIVYCDDGYVIYAYNESRLVVLELMCEGNAILNMLAILKRLCKTDELLIRMPPWLADECDSFGMIKNLADINTEEFYKPYLGLVFD